MVIHRREICSPTGTICAEPMVEGDERTDAPELVTCEKCAVRWQVLLEAHRKHPPLSTWLPQPRPSQPTLFETGRDPSWRGDLVDLLVQARRAGARELEVRPDGSFRAVLDPQPPALPAAPLAKPLTPEERRKADDEMELHSADERE